MNPISSVLQNSIKLSGNSVPGALDRHSGIAGFDQQSYSRAKVVCIGAGGLIGNVAPVLVRKGVGALAILDHDEVEITNLNRQRFYPRDIGENKAIALARNLLPECTFATRITGFASSIQKAIGTGIDLQCSVAVCGVDNNAARIVTARYFRSKGIPVIFMGVSLKADHGYVFVQDKEGPCFGCLFPDAIDDITQPCPGTPAMAEILQLVGSFGSYAIDSLICDRPRDWQYREIWLNTTTCGGARKVTLRGNCPLHTTKHQLLT
ncbi:MAG TPA: ThiF family adenylyltransferase [Terriglobales bacterium]